MKDLSKVIAYLETVKETAEERDTTTLECKDWYNIARADLAASVLVMLWEALRDE